MKPIIVGFDPGTTAAIAVLDTKGQIILLKSKRSFKKSEIITLITEIGKPLMIAGDRQPLPKGVEKLASALGCKAYHPIKTLSVSEKQKLVNEFAGKIKDEHVKDALAAAIKAFNMYSKIFYRTEQLLSSLGLSGLYEKVINSVLTGEVENINEAVNKLLTDFRKKQVTKVDEVNEKRSLTENTRKLKERVEILEKDVTILKNYNQKLKDKLKENEGKFENYRKSVSEKKDDDSLKIIERLKNELKEKESFIELLKTFRKMELNGYIPILEVNEIKVNTINDLGQKFDLTGMVILVNKFDNIQILNDYKIKAVISTVEPGKEIIEKVNFPVVVKKDISIEKMKDISFVKKDAFEEVLNKVRKAGFVQWIEGHKKRKF